MLWKEKRITTNDATTARTIKKAVESLWFVLSNHPVSHHELTCAWDIEDHVLTVPAIALDATILRT